MMRTFRHLLPAAFAGALALAQATDPPTPLPNGPRTCQPMPECLVIIGPGGSTNDGPMNRSWRPAPSGAPMVAPSPNTATRSLPPPRPADPQPR